MSEIPLYQISTGGGSQLKNNRFTEICSGSEKGSYLRLIDVVSLNSRLESSKEEEEGLGVSS